MSYLAKEYANLLNDETVISLFEELIKINKGNRTKAAKKCGLSRKTVYDWPATKEDIKLSTKIKVLDEAFNQIPEESLEKIMERLSDSGTDVLTSYLSSIYEKAFSAKSKKNLSVLLDRFNIISEKYSGWIYKNLDFELEDMMEKLASYSETKNIDWKKPIVHLIPKTQNKVDTFQGLEIKTESQNQLEKQREVTIEDRKLGAQNKLVRGISR